jgi:hypothetical protein
VLESRRFNATVEPAAPDPEARLSASVWANPGIDAVKTRTAAVNRRQALQEGEEGVSTIVYSL